MAHSVKLSADPAEVPIDHFTPEFKRLKARKPPPNLEDVIDLYLISSTNGSRNSASQGNQIVKQHSVTSNDLKPLTGLKACKDWAVFEFLSPPGFFVILNPFIPGYQKYWASRCVQDFPTNKANITNMSDQQGFDPHSSWHSFAQRSTFEKNDPLRRLRWTTLGYHHDWNTKEYSESNKAEFPPDVHLLAEYIAAVLGFGPYSAQAAIVNYYHMDSTLAGHTDHSEIDLAAPLMSISFGQTAIFLLGGDTKSVKPLALYLRSGDICVMSGHSRLAYHAVPKIMAPWCEEETQRLEKALAFSDPPSVWENDVTCGSSSVSIDGAEQAVSEKTSYRAVPSESTAVVGEASDQSAPVSQIQTSECAKFTAVANKSPGCKQVCSSGSVDRGTGCDEVNSILDTANVYCNPEYMLRLEKMNSQILKTVASLDFEPLGRYLASSRINLNIRQVLPAGQETLPSKTEGLTKNESENKRLKIFNPNS